MHARCSHVDVGATVGVLISLPEQIHGGHRDHLCVGGRVARWAVRAKIARRGNHGNTLCSHATDGLVQHRIFGPGDRDVDGGRVLRQQPVQAAGNHHGVGRFVFPGAVVEHVSGEQSRARKESRKSSVDLTGEDRGYRGTVLGALNRGPRFAEVPLLDPLARQGRTGLRHGRVEHAHPDRLRTSCRGPSHQLLTIATDAFAGTLAGCSVPRIDVVGTVGVGRPEASQGRCSGNASGRG